MERLNDVFTFDADKEAYIQELQATLDKLEDLVNHAAVEEDDCPVWEYVTEKSSDSHMTLAYTVINLLSTKNNPTLYDVFNGIIHVLDK